MNRQQDPRPERPVRDLRVAAMLSTVGLTLALSVCVGVGLGLLADHYWHTHGWGVMVGSLLGIAAGFKQLIQTVMRANEEQEQMDRDAARERDENRPH